MEAPFDGLLSAPTFPSWSIFTKKGAAQVSVVRLLFTDVNMTENDRNEHEVSVLLENLLDFILSFHVLSLHSMIYHSTPFHQLCFICHLVERSLQGYRSWKTRKVMERKNFIFHAWKVMSYFPIFPIFSVFSFLFFYFFEQPCRWTRCDWSMRRKARNLNFRVELRDRA